MDNLNLELTLKIDDIVQNLNKISIFGGLNKNQLYTLLKDLSIKYYRDSQTIFNQGDSPKGIYIVLKGKVKIYSMIDETPMALGEFNIGECFGESSFIGIMPHTATAYAKGYTELIFLSRKYFMDLYKSNMDIFTIIILNIARELSRRLNHSSDILLHYALEKNHWFNSLHYF